MCKQAETEDVAPEIEGHEHSMGTCIGMRRATCIGVCVDLCIDLCKDMCVDLSVDVCAGMCATRVHGEVSGVRATEWTST